MSEFRFKNNEKGFTLVELLVVMVIIGILVAIAVPIYTQGTTQANRRAVEANLRTIESAIMRYGAITKGDIPDKEDLDTYFMEWPEGPDGVEYDVSAGRAVISEVGTGAWFTAAEGDSLPITW